MQVSLWGMAEDEARSAVEGAVHEGHPRPATYASHPAYQGCVRLALQLMGRMPNPADRIRTLREFALSATATP